MAELKSFQSQVTLADDQTLLILSEETTCSAGNEPDRAANLYQGSPAIPLGAMGHGAA